MKLEEFLQSKLLELPKSWSKEGYSSYYSAIIDIGDKYLKLLEKLDESEIEGSINYLGAVNKRSLISGAQKVYQAVIHTLRIYLDKGDPYLAYKKFDEYFTFNESLENSEQPVFYLETIAVYPYHYRIREFNGEVKRTGMFHVPFDQRDILRSNRFSISGVPSLYLSNSIYTAYKELGDPDYDHLHVAKFEFTKSVLTSNSVLDLTYKTSVYQLANVYRYLASWPLIMAATIKVDNPNANFKAEYILPQLVSNWVKNNIYIGKEKLLGVKYTSTKFSTLDKANYGHFYNTVIFTQQTNDKGYCKYLKDSFLVSEPINFRKEVDRDIKVGTHGQIRSLSLFGSRVDYIDTDFGKLEEILSNANRPKRLKI